MKNRQFITKLFIVAIALFLIWFIPANFEIVKNHSESLPYNFVLVKKGMMPSRLDQVFVFNVYDNKILKVSKVKFIKLVGGLQGDDIRVSSNHDVFVAGRLIGNAKAISKKGQKLSVIELEKIPLDKVFAYSPHKDSFDSRYKEVGLVDEKDIVGTAIMTF